MTYYGEPKEQSIHGVAFTGKTTSVSFLNLGHMVKYSICILLGFCVFISKSYSQDQKMIDSLYAVLKNQSGGERFPALYELAFQYLQNDNVKALTFIQQAEEVALLSGDSLIIVKSRRVKGMILYFLEKYQASTISLNTALPVATRNHFKEEQMNILLFLGILYIHQGSYDKGLSFYFQSLQLTKELKDREQSAVILHNIGMAYYKLKDYHKAVEYYLMSLNANGLSKARSEILFTNISLSYAFAGDLQNAKIYIERSRAVCREECGVRGKINLNYALGLIAKMEEKYRVAQRYFVESYALAETCNDTRFQFDNIYLLTEIFIEQKDFKNAELYLGKAEELIGLNSPFNLEIIKIYFRFSEFYTALRDFEKASFYQWKYIQLKDSVYSEEQTNNLMKVEAENVERENRTKLEAQEQIIRLNEEIISHQKKLNLVAGVVALLAAAFMILIFKNYQKKRMLNKLLDRKINERTKELEMNRNELLKTLKQQELKIQRASAGIAERIHTLRGLCSIVRSEMSNALACNYIDKIDNTSLQIDKYVRSVFQEENLIMPH